MSFFSFFADNMPVVFQALMSHLKLSGISVLYAIVIAVPLGILLTRCGQVAKWVIAAIGLVQTIPGLVMLGIGLMFFGLGERPAIIVLTAYAILPIMQNTYTGIHEVDGLYIEAAKGIGMGNLQVLWRVELPLSLSAIIAGIRISVVYTISWATLAALIGAGGLGDLIWTGLSCYNTNMILAGAIPASLLAVLTGLLIDLLQKKTTPRGLRLNRGQSE